MGITSRYLCFSLIYFSFSIRTFKYFNLFYTSLDCTRVKERESKSRNLTNFLSFGFLDDKSEFNYRRKYFFFFPVSIRSIIIYATLLQVCMISTDDFFDENVLMLIFPFRFVRRNFVFNAIRCISSELRHGCF